MDRRIYKVNSSSLEDILTPYDSSQVFVLCDESLLADGERLLVNGGLPYPTMAVHASEENKSLETVIRVWNWLTEQGATRKALLINVGGGVTCDIGGFVAATYMRGIDYINIPTTLLAMVDAAIGGKTGVNLYQRPTTNDQRPILLKNRVGAFHLPKAVLIEPAFLQTLPKDELLSGYAEVLKTALLIGEEAFAKSLIVLENNPAIFETQPRRYRDALINECRAYKESIVAQDPTETGLRKVLNFGHTVGHALEESGVRSHESGLRSKHGYCVLWGMIAELYLSVVLLGCPKEPLQQLTKVMLDYYGRPSCNCKEQKELIDLMRKDKKNACESAINFTLLQKAGDPKINQVASEEVIEEALDYLFSI